MPQLSLFAAFSFVLMMFNLPLPGGTTGHAVGVGAAAIVLGPEAAILSISLALLIQALFFGDGGVTTYGANCFNMAIVGSLVSTGVYRLLTRGAPKQSARHIWAGALAGYVAINAAAVCAALEFGIQPMLFHDRAGVPLYAPYPLSVALPAMLAGHLTVAGFAEGIVTAGLLRFLQRSQSPLWIQADTAPAVQLRRARTQLWAIIGTLAVLCPLGLLALGTAWGEWSSSDLQAQLGLVPLGLKSLADLYRAPVPDYSPAIASSPTLGYWLSAAVGLVAITAGSFLMRRFLRKPVRNAVAQTLQSILEAVTSALLSEQLSALPGFLQRVDARAKLIGFSLTLLASLLVSNLFTLCAVLGAVVVAAGASRLPVHPLFTRIWLTTLSFTGLIALPALVLTPGPPAFTLVQTHLSVTTSGILAALRLVFHTLAATSLITVLLQTTPWSQILRALRSLYIPAAVVGLISIAYRYAFLILELAGQTLEASQARAPGRLEWAKQRNIVTNGLGVLFERASSTSSEVHRAMQARGFRGELKVLDSQPWTGALWLALMPFLLFSAVLIVFRR